MGTGYAGRRKRVGRKEISEMIAMISHEGEEFELLDGEEASDGGATS